MPVPTEKVLFTGVSILDSTGAVPYPGDVLIENDRIATVGTVDPARSAGARVVQGRGRTLMSGLCDAHTHFTWNNSADLDGLGTMPVEEHLLFAIESARTYIDSGYTMCVGAASAKPRLDVVCRDAINAGRIPGPRYLANGPEIAVTGGALIPSITTFADGPEGMRKAVRELIGLGVDQIKLSMTGEEITGTLRAEDTYFSDEEVAAAVTEAHRRGVRVCAHARSAESVKMCVRHGVDIIYHASFTDAEGMDMLEAAKDWVFVAPGINWLVATLYEAESFGFPQEAAEAVGYKRELEIATEGLREMHRRGIKLLPGGDYGFAWTPHGTYARDLEHFVERLGFTPMEAILSATALGGEIMLRPDELGKVQPGYLADLILVDGDPLADITILQDQDRLHYIMKDGRFHKEHAAEPVAAAA
ncbi:metal-dependent hydrolase family protein [Pseudonocardia acidicola]|uniref:Amidohydrolase family protein n=1 Tax=Pseudonocardia acidicola TaxID=2724939 RepID=A0ABX1S691_9PSEU|nr:amidohydrolase family protein [Pseudonocardia acidicola]NMH95988.1 amidohydrolase family protein [Pseudonocardia acidicola]